MKENLGQRPLAWRRSKDEGLLIFFVWISTRFSKKKREEYRILSDLLNCADFFVKRKHRDIAYSTLLGPYYNWLSLAIKNVAEYQHQINKLK